MVNSIQSAVQNLEDAVKLPENKRSISFCGVHRAGKKLRQLAALVREQGDQLSEAQIGRIDAAKLALRNIVVLNRSSCWYRIVDFFIRYLFCCWVAGSRVLDDLDNFPAMGTGGDHDDGSDLLDWDRYRVEENAYEETGGVFGGTVRQVHRRREVHLRREVTYSSSSSSSSPSFSSSSSSSSSSRPSSFGSGGLGGASYSSSSSSSSPSFSSSSSSSSSSSPSSFGSGGLGGASYSSSSSSSSPSFSSSSSSSSSSRPSSFGSGGLGGVAISDFSYEQAEQAAQRARSKDEAVRFGGAVAAMIYESMHLPVAAPSGASAAASGEAKARESKGAAELKSLVADLPKESLSLLQWADSRMSVKELAKKEFAAGSRVAGYKLDAAVAQVRSWAEEAKYTRLLEERHHLPSFRDRYGGYLSRQDKNNIYKVVEAVKKVPEAERDGVIANIVSHYFIPGAVTCDDRLGDSIAEAYNVVAAKLGEAQIDLGLDGRVKRFAVYLPQAAFDEAWCQIVLPGLRRDEESTKAWYREQVAQQGWAIGLDVKSHHSGCADQSHRAAFLGYMNQACSTPTALIDRIYNEMTSGMTGAKKSSIKMSHITTFLDKQGYETRIDPFDHDNEGVFEGNAYSKKVIALCLVKLGIARFGAAPSSSSSSSSRRTDAPVRHSGGSGLGTATFYEYYGGGYGQTEWGQRRVVPNR